MSRFLTFTTTSPDVWGGETALIDVEVKYVPVTSVSPNITIGFENGQSPLSPVGQVSIKPAPVIVTEVPPELGPEDGLIPVTFG